MDSAPKTADSPEQSAAVTRLSQAKIPDRLNEDWRFGRPRQYAAALAGHLSATSPNEGRITIQAPAGIAYEPGDVSLACEQLMPTIGSDALLSLHLKRFGKGATLILKEGIQLEAPIIITYETDSLFTPSTHILAAPGTKAHIIERHISHGEACLFCTRTIQVMNGADIRLELEEEGSGHSSAMNITHICNRGGRLRQLTIHRQHLWAREETIAETKDNGNGFADIQLYSANRLGGKQVLDQHTRQLHHVGNATSNLLYKNVLDDDATAIFAGNIYVAPGAHETDAYQANRNMMLSEQATVHSLPGLEILADHVRCSHGSATAPMDNEQLFYLLSRGIPQHEAQLLVADGFLADALNLFKREGGEGEPDWL